MELFMLLLSVIFFFAFISHLCLRSFRNQRKRLPPGSYGWPILGETIPYLAASSKGNIREFVNKRQGKNNSGIIKSSLFGAKCIILSGPVAIKFMCTNEKRFVTGWRPRSLQKLFPSSFDNPIEDDPKKQRGYIGLLFRSESVSNLVHSVESVTKSHLNKHWKIGEEVKVYDSMKLYAFTVACRMFLSIEDSDQISKLLTPFIDLTAGLISLAIYFPGTRYYRAKNSSILLQKEIGIIIKQRREILSKNVEEAPKDLLTQMLITPNSIDGKLMSEMQIIDYILGFLFAGHETTAATLTFTLKHLVDHPQLATQVFKEQEEIIEMMKPRNELIWEDVQKMKKTWNFVSESMRLLPSIPAFLRQATTDFSFDAFLIPKGWTIRTILISIHCSLNLIPFGVERNKIFMFMECTQMDPEYFPDPEKFDPSRFEKNGPQPYTYFPFGGGTRICPGKELARAAILIFLHHVLKNFKWKPSIPEEGMAYKLVPIPNNGFPVQLFPRSA